MELPEDSAKRKFPNHIDKQTHYISILKWLMNKGKRHKIAIKIATHNTINKFSKNEK